MEAADFAKYYVDGDNCPGVRTAGIEVLQEEEEVIVFYAASNTHYGSEKVREKLRGKTKAHLSFEAVPAGKNAVDFAIAARVGADLQAGRRIFSGCSLVRRRGSRFFGFCVGCFSGSFWWRRRRRRRRRGSAGRRGRFGKFGGAGKQGRQGNSENEQMYKKLYLTFIPKLIILSV